MTPAIRNGIKAIVTFVKAPTWVDGKRIVEARRDILLTDEVEDYFNVLWYPLQDDPETTQIFIEHRDLLRRCRQEGVDTAFAALSPDQPKPVLPANFKETMEAFQARATTMLEMLGLDSKILSSLQEIVDPAFEQNPDVLSIFSQMMGSASGQTEQSPTEQQDTEERSSEQTSAMFTMMEQILGQMLETPDMFSNFMRAAEEGPPVELLSFIYAETWDESRDYLMQHPELLNDQTEHELELMIQRARQAGAEDEERTFTKHLELIRRSCEVGINQAYSELTRSSPHVLVNLVIEFCAQETWPKRKLFLQQNPILLDNKIDEILTWVTEQAQQEEDPIFYREVTKYCTLLRRCREVGIDQAFALVPETLLDTFIAFINIEKWAECHQYLQQHPELLSDEADQMIEHMRHELQQQNMLEVIRILSEHRTLLRRCREVGIDQAFAERIGLATEAPQHFHDNIRRAKDTERRYLLTDDPDALDDALAEWGEILKDSGFDSTPPPFKVAVLQSTADMLLRRYHSPSQDMEDLDRALQFWRQALEQISPESPELPALLNKLGTNLHERYMQSGNQQDLEEAITCYRRVLEAIPVTSPDRPLLLKDLGLSLHERYTISTHTHGLSDLNEAITCYRQALEEISTTSPERAEILGKISTGLSDRYAAIGDLKDLEESLEYQSQVSGSS